MADESTQDVVSGTIEIERRYTHSGQAHQAVITLVGEEFRIGPSYFFRDAAEAEVARFTTALAKALAKGMNETKP